MLLVQEFLQNHTLKELQEKHGVYCRFSKSGHKASFNYDQIEAKENDPLAQECRGLILALEDSDKIRPTIGNLQLPSDNLILGKTKVLGYPMRRFFNYGQGAAANINWSDPNLAVLEKLDGTLCIVYHDPFIDQWCVATRSVSEADLLMDNGIFTFRTLFEKALFDTTGLSFDEYVAKLDKGITYCFELTTPYNRVVVEYKNNGITLLAMRELTSLQEISFNELKDLYGVPVVQAHTYTSVEDIVNWVSSLNPLEHEGVVVRDSNFNRIKVKNAGYIAYNKLHDRLGSSERNLMEFILLETDDDIISALAPEIGQNMVKLKEGLQKALIKYDSVYHLIQGNLETFGLKGNKKEFAIRISTNHKDMWHAPFFQMFDGKASNMKDFIQKNKKDGTWGDSFLDKILQLAKQHN